MVCTPLYLRTWKFETETRHPAHDEEATSLASLVRPSIAISFQLVLQTCKTDVSRIAVVLARFHPFMTQDMATGMALLSTNLHLFKQ
jgi:hypothetical protein